MILDCVSAGATQTDICSVFSATGSKRYASIITSTTAPVPEDVTRVDVDGWSLLEMPGGDSVLPALTGLVEEGRYKIPVGVKGIGRGLERIPDVMDEVMKASGEKLVLAL